MTDFEATIRKLTKAQRAALDAIAVNDDRGHHPRTCEALVRKGLVVERKEVLGAGIDRFPITIKRYDMPLPVHLAWCQLCSAEYDAMSPEEQEEAER